MSTVARKNDAFGEVIWAYFNGGPPCEIVERDDGYIGAAESTLQYFAEFSHWPRRQKTAIRFVRGTRALDVGCGAGRVALFLQKKGIRVTAIDSSPLAVRTCKKRGVKDARVMRFEEIGRLRRKKHFNTIVMFGNNFGLFGSYRKAKKLLRTLHRLTTDEGLIVAESINPYKTDDPAHLRYQRLNRRRGRMAGQIRIRIRFQRCATPWFDYLFVSPEEMKDILQGTGWKARRFIGDGSARYVAVIEKV